MSEAKRVPTWGEIFKVEAAAESLSASLAELGRIAPIIDPDDVDDATSNAAFESERAVRYLRGWLDVARRAREAEDLERKKAGLD